MTNSNEAERYVDAQTGIVPYIAECKHIDWYIVIGPVKMNKIENLIWHSSSDLTLLNNFLVEAINNQYSLIQFLSWYKDPY